MQLPIQKSARNRSCGDSVTLGIEYDETNQRIKSIVHHAEGCMLCRASASILCLVVEGRDKDEILVLKNYVDAICSLEQIDEKPITPGFLSIDQSRDLESLVEVRNYPTRFKCVKLAWDSLV
jgi:NifU-like protein involved in Fe-S cluster formation